jgi:hypothetical protein
MEGKRKHVNTVIKGHGIVHSSTAAPAGETTTKKGREKMKHYQIQMRDPFKSTHPCKEIHDLEIGP